VLGLRRVLERERRRYPASHNWASCIVSRVASAAQDELPNNRAALDWLAYRRGLPVHNTDWLADNDLGALSGDIDISSIGYAARGIWSEEKSYRLTRVEALRIEAADKKGSPGRSFSSKSVLWKRVPSITVTLSEDHNPAKPTPDEVTIRSSAFVQKYIDARKNAPKPLD
jgi:hypothetical protein